MSGNVRYAAFTFMFRVMRRREGQQNDFSGWEGIRMQKGGWVQREMVMVAT